MAEDGPKILDQCLRNFSHIRRHKGSESFSTQERLLFSQILKLFDSMGIKVQRVSNIRGKLCCCIVRCEMFQKFRKNCYFLFRLIVEPESDHGFVFKTMASSLLQQNSDSTYRVRNFPLIVFSGR